MIRSHFGPAKLLQSNPPVLAMPNNLPLVLVALFICTSFPWEATAQRYDYRAARREMVENEIIAAGVKDRRVIEVLLKTDRHEFIPRNLRRMAYFDMSLPIGEEQTISSPFIVSFMTESLDTKPTDKVLEIGTGSGFQAAVLSPLVKDVYTIEIVEPLGLKAKKVLKRLKYKNVHVKIGDGFKGWPEHAPFDKIIVTCSPEKVPVPLIEQLREGGRMVIPVGERYQQTLYQFTKKDGELEKEALRPTLFVPMTGTAEDTREKQPDPTNPSVVNGDFEESTTDEAIVPGWYYGRQVRVVDTNSGQHIRFSNQESGRASHLLQGLAIDARSVSRLKLSGRVQLSNVKPTRDGSLPVMMLTFYDQHRADVGRNWVGPWRGSKDWMAIEKTFRVPAEAREAILRIGLFGATGEVEFDDVSISKP